MHNNKIRGIVVSRLSIVVFASFFLAGTGASCASHDSVPQSTKVNVEPTPPVAANASGAIERPRDEAIVESLESHREIRGSRFEDLKDLRAPEIVFVFGSERKMLKQLSADGSKIVEEHWTEALRRFYDTQFDPPQSAEEQVERDRAWASVCQQTQQSLMNAQIEAPGGRRKISYTESSETYALLNRLALDVVRKAMNLHATPLKI